MWSKETGSMAVVSKAGPHTQRTGGTREKGAPGGVAGGRFDEPEDLHSRLVFDAARRQISSPDRQNLKS